jgi:hypothetical protein
MHWTEASSLVCLDFRKSNFYPSKLDLRISGLVLLVFWYFWYSGALVLLVFWYFWYSGTLILLVFWYFVKTRVSLSGRSSH